LVRKCATVYSPVSMFPTIRRGNEPRPANQANQRPAIPRPKIRRAAFLTSAA
jgi:hypothetical protein